MKENFDDILKRKWEEQHFPVDEQHRADMIALLDGQKRRRIVPFWWLGGLGLAAIFAGYFMLSQQAPPSPDGQQQSVSLDVKSSGNTEISTGSSLNTEANEPANSEIEKSTINNGNNTIVPAAVNTDQAANTNTNTNSNKQAKALAPSTPKSKQVKEVAKPVQPKQTEQAAPKPAIPITQTTGQPVSLPAAIGTAPDGTFRVDDSAARSYQIVSKAASVTVEDPEADIMPYIPPKPGSRTSFNVNEIDLLELSGIHYAADYTPGQIKPQTSFKHMVYLFGEAGAGIILASKPDYSTGWKLRAGAGLGYTLSPKVQLSWAAGYLLQAGGFDFQRTSTVTQPGFGTRSSFNSLSPDKLHFVYSRLGAQYRLHRSVFGAHGGIQYLYGAQGDIVVQTHDQFASAVSETTSYDWVKTDGLRKLHWTADVSYGYQLTPRLVASVGTDIYFSSFTVSDAALAQDGYYWDGAFAALHPFVTLNYIFYGSK
ncbi:MAG: hypothetical protein IPL92_07600 [Saprospiraceae bacterium]|nr:hypothetical protein [Candidatus Opimibacter iunctus]